MRIHEAADDSEVTNVRFDIVKCLVRCLAVEARIRRPITEVARCLHA